MRSLSHNDREAIDQWFIANALPSKCELFNTAILASMQLEHLAGVRLAFMRSLAMSRFSLDGTLR